MWRKDIKSFRFYTYLIFYMANGKSRADGSQMEIYISIISISLSLFHVLMIWSSALSLSIAVLKVCTLLTFPCLSWAYGPNFPVFSDMQTVSNYPPGHCEEHVKREQTLHVFKHTPSHMHTASDCGQFCSGLCQHTGLPGRSSCRNRN